MDQHLKELDEECAQYRELLDYLKEGSDARLMDRNIVAAKLAAMKVTEIYYPIMLYYPWYCCKTIVFS